MQRLKAHSLSAVVATSAAAIVGNVASTLTSSSSRYAYSSSRVLHGMEQLEDVPYSSDRKPRGKHRGPDKRMTSATDRGVYEFVKAWDLQMQEQWDDLEAFKGQPKPKKQFGNEACEVVWPYCMLMESVVRIHRFTKSIYVYYPHKQSTKDGTFRAEVAKRFSRECLIPITFHNSQCYIETEMLVEHGETPWIVMHCLDGTVKIIPISMKASEFGAGNVLAAKDALLAQVLETAHEMGEAVADVQKVAAILNERAPQNQYVRVDYQWFGDTPEDRMTHLVQWNFEGRGTTPSTTKFPQQVMRSRLNTEVNFPVGGKPSRAMGKSMRMRPYIGGGTASFLNGQGKRQNARYSPSGGAAGQVF